MKIGFYSPSRKRSGSALTHKILPTVRYCVPENEVKEYSRNFENVISMPEETNGNMAKVRNWLLNNTDEEKIVMLDDDVTAIQWVEDHEDERVRRVLKTNEILKLIFNGFQLLEDINMKLFGINLQNDPRFCRSNKPFTFYLPVLGPFSAIIKSELRYDEELPLKEDYDFFLQNVDQYGGVLRFNQAHYCCDHQKISGGCQLYRNSEKEELNKNRLIKKWGSDIINFKDEDINPIIRI